MSDQISLPVAPRMRTSTKALLIGIVLLVIASFVSLSLKWQAFFSKEAIDTTVEFLRGFSPPEMATPFLARIAEATLETLAMSAIGTLLAALFGMLLCLFASGRFGLALRLITRGILNVLRSIPELVWAAILLIAAGLGPFAGTLALAIHTTGVLGRLFADTLENCPPHSEDTLRLNGVRPSAAFLYATLPHCSPQMMSYVLYRWENNIRAAAILGVVGAGGLGQMLKYHLSLFQMHQAATVIIAMLLLVCVVDATSFALRRKMTR
ncbi:MAG: phosphonate ABC transporter, permease protein PhnE [Oxalicibacterium faecigallinarum]|uniref:phosphonate ABC transporter, permease protein PhnE n=1 Tax=Oxalicibacterium faecigallinarum TaxID=573741 RepID=UPI00280A13DC|nr:phosphonate ABC transporter, permease protein PhnE [Oxalicibacterium faecigallinarum]MDQ7970178.1 phosphonate ABC transporter, permease protein PhnE [Oxalicibacterium faecigallinarum]